MLKLPHPKQATQHSKSRAEVCSNVPTRKFALFPRGVLLCGSGMVLGGDLGGFFLISESSAPGDL